MTGNLPVVARVTVTSIAMAGLRHTKIVIVPLAAYAVGLNLGEVSLLLAVAGIAGILTLWVGVRFTRRYGYQAVGIVSNAGTTVGLVVLLLADGSQAAVIGAVLAIELVNSLSAGYMSTVFALNAPPAHPAALIGVFSMIAETVGLAVPAALMGVVAIATLPAGIAAGALLGVAGTIHLWRIRSPRPSGP